MNEYSSEQEMQKLETVIEQLSYRIQSKVIGKYLQIDPGLDPEARNQRIIDGWMDSGMSNEYRRMVSDSQVLADIARIVQTSGGDAEDAVVEYLCNQLKERVNGNTSRSTEVHGERI